MLMQSDYFIPRESSSGTFVTCIELLPALPENWKDGSISGIRARGGIAVDMTWQGSRVTALTLTAQQGGVVMLTMNGETKKVILKKGKNTIVPSKK